MIKAEDMPMHGMVSASLLVMPIILPIKKSRARFASFSDALLKFNVISADKLTVFAEQARQRHHSTAAQAARCAQEAGAGRLLLAHFSSRIKDLSPLLAEARAIFPDTVLLSDGDLFDLSLQKP